MLEAFLGITITIIACNRLALFLGEVFTYGEGIYCGLAVSCNLWLFNMFILLSILRI